jgi:hypothetical protein
MKERVSRSLVEIFIGKKCNLSFMIGFDGSNIIINFSTCMYAKRIILYLFKRSEPTLTSKSKIIQIESLYVELFTIKIKNLFKLKVNVLSVFIKELVIQLMQFLFFR